MAKIDKTSIGKKITLVSPDLKDYAKVPLECEPKRTNRWFVTFPEVFEIPSWVVSKTERPSIKINGNLNEINPITFIFIDPIGPSTTPKIMRIIRAMLNNEGETNLIDTLKNGFEYNLELLDPIGVTIEKWIISGCDIISVDFGDLSYSEDEIVKCTMVIQPKKIKLQD